MPRPAAPPPSNAIPDVIYFASVEWAPPPGAPSGFGFVGTVTATFSDGRPHEVVERTAPHALEWIAQQAAATLRAAYQTHYNRFGRRLEESRRAPINPPRQPRGLPFGG